MAGPGQIPGRYNIIIEGEHDVFDHQIPVEEFIKRLDDDDVPDTVSVVGLGDAFTNSNVAAELARAMDRRANDLEYQSPTIQFVVKGSIHRNENAYDLRYNDAIHTLQQVFGPQLERKGEGDWLVAPF